jgi:hypothetical protein
VELPLLINEIMSSPKNKNMNGKAVRKANCSDGLSIINGLNAVTSGLVIYQINFAGTSVKETKPTRSLTSVSKTFITKSDTNLDNMNPNRKKIIWSDKSFKPLFESFLERKNTKAPKVKIQNAMGGYVRKTHASKAVARNLRPSIHEL